MGDLEKQEEKVVVLDEEKEGEEEKERLLEGTAVLDFDMLCSSVALQTAHGTWGKLGGTNFGGDDDDDGEQRGEEFGGVLRMWEGEVLDCFDHRCIALESTCCPCYRFGKNMKRAGLGSCYIQAFVYFLLAICALFNSIAFIVTRHHYFLYIAVAFIITGGAYLGFYRTRMRKKFNIKGSDSLVDDCVYHFVCPCCTLCQESRTLEINNVQDGTWHGRGGTICIGGIGDRSKELSELIPPPIESINLTNR
ncbi:protein PLANT CADMIUM RESISTANCE 8-like [Cicer arietinum]|uniref:Protein PLANT CADMIUM RESISTANCE 8-like n=1 Tax=Cicer arietinum TaxID=3827 RepID=A0A1S3E5K8_CICAR|nr:protein PLANT CADMIUM RESISTANCE 8-like [Cicer arietinum]